MQAEGSLLAMKKLEISYCDGSDADMYVGHGTCMVVVTEPIARYVLRHRSGHSSPLGW